jgi:cysteine desulfurase
MKNKRIYLDNAATTSLRNGVLEAMAPYFSDKFGNASSLHSFGQEAKEALDESRVVIAKKLNAKPDEIIFTSGGTESNNLALKGIAFRHKDKGKHIITTKIEHSSILNPLKWVEKEGFEVTYLDVDSQGRINLNELESSIRKDTILVSVGHGNNEIGTLQDLTEIGRITSEKDVLFHTDACQTFTKHMIDVEVQNLDLVTINAHKIYGPKGVGALYIRDGTKITPVNHGGQHEKNLRGGTENIPGIVGFAKAAELMNRKDILHMQELRDALVKKVLLEVEGSQLNGHPCERICNNANFTFPGVEGESLILRIDMRGIAGSTGSACSSQSLMPSHVLLAIGLKPEDAHGSLRITTGLDSSIEDMNYAASVIEEEVAKLRKMSPTWKKK